jgi:hypothetical protein
MATGGSDPLHLVEVGLAWPPDTFLRGTLAGLAQRGFRVTVVTESSRTAGFELPGVEVVSISKHRGGLARTALGAARDWLRLRTSRRDRLPAVRAASAGLRGRRLRERLRWLRLLTVLVDLRPDVMHFEWESAAVKFLPLTDLWGCPMVMSCRGGLGLYSRSPVHSRAVAGVAEAFGRAAVVHCVSEAVLDEATRHGLDPVKAQVIRGGVDLGAFAPLAR